MIPTYTLFASRFLPENFWLVVGLVTVGCIAAILASFRLTARFGGGQWLIWVGMFFGMALTIKLTRGVFLALPGLAAGAVVACLLAIIGATVFK